MSDTTSCRYCGRAAGWHDQYTGCPGFAPDGYQCNDFAFWTFRRPVGHSKSRAVLSGDAPMVEQWAYAPVKDGVIWKSATVSGFASRDEAETHAARHASPTTNEGVQK